jgi:hypothetical protein
VQVRYDEGVAIHIGPEPCGGAREDAGEASAGECIGDAVSGAEGNTDGCAIASAWTARRGRRPWHVQTLLVREPGDLVIGQGGEAEPGPHREGEEP